MRKCFRKEFFHYPISILCSTCVHHYWLCCDARDFWCSFDLIFQWLIKPIFGIRARSVSNITWVLVPIIKIFYQTIHRIYPVINQLILIGVPSIKIIEQYIFVTCSFNPMFKMIIWIFHRNGMFSSEPTIPLYLLYWGHVTRVRSK